VGRPVWECLSLGRETETLANSAHPLQRPVTLSVGTPLCPYGIAPLCPYGTLQQVSAKLRDEVAKWLEVLTDSRFVGRKLSFVGRNMSFLGCKVSLVGRDSDSGGLSCQLKERVGGAAGCQHFNSNVPSLPRLKHSQHGGPPGSV
jgi:hypothetical protein